MKPTKVISQPWINRLNLLEDDVLGVDVWLVCLHHLHGSPSASQFNLKLHLGLVHEFLKPLFASDNLVVAELRHVNGQLVEVGIFFYFFLLQIRHNPSVDGRVVFLRYLDFRYSASIFKHKQGRLLRLLESDINWVLIDNLEILLQLLGQLDLLLGCLDLVCLNLPMLLHF